VVGEHADGFDLRVVQQVCFRRRSRLGATAFGVLDAAGLLALLAELPTA
jgi:hypothetical protein